MNKMKKISIISLLLLLSFSTVFGQKKNIVNAALYLETSQKSKGDDIVKILRMQKNILMKLSIMNQLQTIQKCGIIDLKYIYKLQLNIHN